MAGKADKKLTIKTKKALIALIEESYSSGSSTSDPPTELKSIRG